MTGRNRRILVLDDSPPYLDFMRTLLNSEGFDVATAATVQAAQCELRERHIDLLITDALLPGMAPFGVLDLIKQEPRTADLPILICSGAVRELNAARERLERQGVAVLQKPFDIDELLNCVAALLPEDSRPSNPS
jgi:DNA-binding response OmpR family regulator